LTSAAGHKQILFVDPPPKAQLVLPHLRTAGYSVSLAQDLDAAERTLRVGTFDHVVLSGAVLEMLLRERPHGPNPDAEFARTISIETDRFESLMRSLSEGTENRAARTRATRGSDLHSVKRAISLLSSYLAELTRELTGVSENELNPTVLDLEDLIEAAAITVYHSAADRHQRLVIDIDAEVAKLCADGIKLKRILATLLAYASDRTPTLGSVRVHAYLDEAQPVISISCAAAEITRSDLRKLLGRDSGSRPISRVRRLADQHGCRLWVQSEKGMGTTLFLGLPSWSEVPAGMLSSSTFS